MTTATKHSYDHTPETPRVFTTLCHEMRGIPIYHTGISVLEVSKVNTFYQSTNIY
jgi:hypothetical protein